MGGVLIGPKEAFHVAYERQKQLVEMHLPRLAWEVNYWAMLTEEGLFDLYPADHDDSMLNCGTLAAHWLHSGCTLPAQWLHGR